MQAYAKLINAILKLKKYILKTLLKTISILQLLTLIKMLQSTLKLLPLKIRKTKLPQVLRVARRRRSRPAPPPGRAEQPSRRPAADPRRRRPEADPTRRHHGTTGTRDTGHRKSAPDPLSFPKRTPRETQVLRSRCRVTFQQARRWTQVVHPAVITILKVQVCLKVQVHMKVRVPISMTYRAAGPRVLAWREDLRPQRCHRPP